MAKRVLLVAAVLLAIAALSAGGALAQEEAEEAGPISINDTVTGLTNGAFNAHEITMPAGEDVTIKLVQESAPCVSGTEAFGAYLFFDKPVPPHTVKMATHESAACTRVLIAKSPHGGPATVIVYNHEDGNIADYRLTIEGAEMAADAEGEIVIPDEPAETGFGMR